MGLFRQAEAALCTCSGVRIASVSGICRVESGAGQNCAEKRKLPCGLGVRDGLVYGDAVLSDAVPGLFL